MSILVIGGDKINSIRNCLQSLGAKKIEHWDSRKVHVTHRIIPDRVDCVVMLTTFLKHNTMFHFKTEAKKKNIPVVFSKRSTTSLRENFKI